MSRVNLMCKYLVYKHSFNSIIYNYSPKTTFELGRVPWSERTINRHIKDFIRLGWVKKEGKHIVFLSKNQLHKTVEEKKKGFYYKINCELNYKEIRTRLYYSILKRKLVQMDYKRHKQKLLHCHKNYCRKSVSREGLRISLLTIAGMFWYKSVSSAKKRVREVVEKRLIFNKRFRPTLIYCDRLGGFRFKNPCTVYYLPTI